MHRSLDLVPKIKREDVQNWLSRLLGNVGIGSVRYTTSGGTDEESLKKGIQPVFAETGKVKVAVAFNGNIVNNTRLKKKIREKFPGFSYECDAELICRKLLIELMETHDLASSVTACMKEVEGAFSVTGITQKGELFTFKDPYGIRPLCCGHSENHEIYATSSETVGLDINGFEQGFEVEPGELVTLSEDGFVREQLVPCKKRALCSFENTFTRLEKNLEEIWEGNILKL